MHWANFSSLKLLFFLNLFIVPLAKNPLERDKKDNGSSASTLFDKLYREIVELREEVRAELREVKEAGKCYATKLEKKIDSASQGKLFPGLLDCTDVVERFGNVSGVWEISPPFIGHSPNVSTSFQVLCDNEKEDGGWVVIQKRGISGDQEPLNFFRKYEEYKKGFGPFYGEFWLGLDSIHRLTTLGNTELRINMEDWEGRKRFATYSLFRVGGPLEGYKLEVDGYFGTAGDSFEYHSGQQFSTYDKDKDASDEINCAAQEKGAWWYRSCSTSNLNSVYSTSPRIEHGYQGIFWGRWKGYKYALKYVEMKIRRIKN